VLVEALDAALPQTQCRRCGEPDCRRYAEALADGRAEIDRCPPGGAEGIVRLAGIIGRAPRPLDATCGQEGPRRLAVIDEALCIGCTLCIQACPVDCIVGAAKRMHTVIEPQCTGCELCVPACPVDCIALLEATPGRSGWQAWSPVQAADSRLRYRAREARLARRRREREQRLAARAGRTLGVADAPATPGAATVATPPTDDAAGNSAERGLRRAHPGPGLCAALRRADRRRTGVTTDARGPQARHDRRGAGARPRPPRRLAPASRRRSYHFAARPHGSTRHSLLPRQRRAARRRTLPDAPWPGLLRAPLPESRR
jgi:electron transport complex protein RnfB